MWSHGDEDFVTAKETVKLRPITCVSWSVSSGSTTFIIIISQFWKNKISVCTLYEVFIDLFYFERCMNEFSWLKMIFLAKIKKSSLLFFVFIWIPFLLIFLYYKLKFYFIDLRFNSKIFTNNLNSQECVKELKSQHTMYCQHYMQWEKNKVQQKKKSSNIKCKMGGKI